ncbi:MAG: ISNCY family transposase, partial [Candidatus Omnitrophica bacterium]|nr:ISNCY family transposase [Candidatus Omnitrophota bacterium]
NEYRDPFENCFDPELFQLSAELKKVDNLLNDSRIIQPFIEKFGTKIGRSTVPVSTYLRMMYLKDRYQFGYESLVEEIKDNIKWRRFCQIPIDKKVPHSTTLIKLTRKYGPEMIEAVNSQLLNQLKAKKILKGKKLRMDSTVVESNIHFPTDAGLLSDSVKKITKIVKEIKKQGVATKTKFRDRTRTVKKTILKLCKNLRKKATSKKESIKEQTKKLLMITKDILKQAKDIAKDAAKATKEDLFDGIKALFDDLNKFTDIANRIQGQTEKVLANKGNTIESRVVSIFDTTARPIKKGKLGIKCEFGNKVVVQDTAQGIITGYQVLEENPSDTSLVDEAIEQHVAVFNKPPDEVATDRGFSSAENEAKLKETIRRVSMPKRGKLDAERKQYQKQHWFRRLQRFRAGGEAKISLLKRKFGLRRSRLRGLQGIKIHVGWGILTHNLWQTARIT